MKLRDRSPESLPFQCVMTKAAPRPLIDGKPATSSEVSELVEGRTDASKLAQGKNGVCATSDSNGVR
jgi:hypothetical protein